MMVSESEVLIHRLPVWRDRSNFVIHAEAPEACRSARFEQLYVRQLAEDRFELCCIPLYVYGLALADKVVTWLDEDRKYIVKQVAEHSGRYVFRARFGQAEDPPYHEIADELTAREALLEWGSRDLLGIDAADDERAHAIVDFLSESQRLGHLIFERG
jgi:hypothetical protein